MFRTKVIFGRRRAGRITDIEWAEEKSIIVPESQFALNKVLGETEERLTAGAADGRKLLEAVRSERTRRKDDSKMHIQGENITFSLVRNLKNLINHLNLPLTTWVRRYEDTNTTRLSEKHNRTKKK